MQRFKSLFHVTSVVIKSHVEAIKVSRIEAVQEMGDNTSIKPMLGFSKDNVYRFYLALLRRVQSNL